MTGTISETIIKVDSKALLNFSVLTYCLLFFLRSFNLNKKQVVNLYKTVDLS